VSEARGSERVDMGDRVGVGQYPPDPPFSRSTTQLTLHHKKQAWHVAAPGWLCILQPTVLGAHQDEYRVAGNAINKILVML
jgi:hypothetical protein